MRPHSHIIDGTFSRCPYMLEGAAQALLGLHDWGPHSIHVGGAAVTYSSSKEPTS